MLNLWIDALPRKAKARVVRWQSWCRDYIVADDGRQRCVIGVAENWHGIKAHDWPAVDARNVVARRYRRWSPPNHASVIDLIGRRWERLVDRVGLEEAARLVKARAAKGDEALIVSLDRTGREVLF